MTGTSRAQREAFTLLEVVAAMVLMTMLFAAMTSVLRCFADQGKTLDAIVENNPSTQRLAKLLRQDLVNARFLDASLGRLRLVGNLARDPATDLSHGNRAEVIYRIDKIADESWLVREQIVLDALTSDRSSEELVWRGATNIAVIAGTVEAEVDAEEVRSQSIPQGMTPMPARLVLILHGELAPIVEVRVVHHWEDN